MTDQGVLLGQNLPTLRYGVTNPPARPSRLRRKRKSELENRESIPTTLDPPKGAPLETYLALLCYLGKKGILKKTKPHVEETRKDRQAAEDILYAILISGSGYRG